MKKLSVIGNMNPTIYTEFYHKVFGQISDLMVKKLSTVLSMQLNSGSTLVLVWPLPCISHAPPKNTHTHTHTQKEKCH